MNFASSARDLEGFCSFLPRVTYDELVALGKSQAVSEGPLEDRIEGGLEARAWAAYHARERTRLRGQHGWRLWRYVTELPVRARWAILVRWAIDWIDAASQQLSQDAVAPLAVDEEGLALCQLGLKALSAALLALGWREQLS